MDYVKIGKNLALARLAEKLTLEEAEQKSGIAYKLINRYENGLSIPIPKLEVLCVIYSVSIQDILFKTASIKIDFI